jgi:hypothetical protein
MFLFTKTLLVVKEKGQLYFFKAVNVITTVTQVALLMTDTLHIFNLITENHELQEMYYTWAISNLLQIIPIFTYLNTFSLLAKTFDIIFYSIKSTLGFLFVIVLSYFIFALIGCSLFGGDVNSKTPFVYETLTNGALNKDYEQVNFNDFLNSIVFCWTLTIDNQTPVMINMASLMSMERQGAAVLKERNYRDVFFICFYVFNNLILFNILVGQIIGEFSG